MSLPAGIAAPSPRRGRGDNLTSHAFQVLRHRILANTIAPGDPIDDAAVARELGMSRTPVRESLLALQERGLVRIVPRVGHFATEISTADIVDAYEVRMLLEPATAEAAAQRISVQEAAGLAQLVGFGPEELSPALFPRAVELNRKFHVGVAEASGNRRLARLFSQLMDDLTRVIHYELAHGLTSGAWRAEHQRILDAIAGHDAIAAGKMVRETILNTNVMIQKGVWVRYRDLLERSSSTHPAQPAAPFVVDAAR